MKTCPDNEAMRWKDALLEHAAGSPPSGALIEHLRSCTVCSAELQQLKDRMTRIDSGILRLADSQPSPQAIPRVIAGLSSRETQAGWWQWNGTMAAAAGFAILLVALLFTWRVEARRIETVRQERQTLAAASAIADWKSPTGELIPPQAVTLLSAPPRLGQYFYQLDSTSSKKENYHP